MQRWPPRAHARLAPATQSAETEAKEDDFDPDAEHYEPNVKRGEVWLLCRHRLMCGDSLNEADVLKLLNGEHAPLTFTDPPYRLDTFGGGVYKQSSSMQQVRENKVDQFEPSKLKLYFETNIYSHNKPHKERYSIREVIDLTQGEYESDKFKNFFTEED